MNRNNARTWHFCTFPDPILLDCNCFSPPILPERDGYHQFWLQLHQRLVRMRMQSIGLLETLAVSATPSELAMCPNCCRSAIRFRCSIVQIFGLNAQLNCTVADDVPVEMCDIVVVADSYHATIDSGYDCDRMDHRDDSSNSNWHHSSNDDATDNVRQCAVGR